MADNIPGFADVHKRQPPPVRAQPTLWATNPRPIEHPSKRALPHGQILREHWQNHLRPEGFQRLMADANPDQTLPLYLPLQLNGTGPNSGQLSSHDWPLLMSYLVDHYRDRPAALRAFIHRYSSLLSRVDFGGEAAVPVPANGAPYIYNDSGRPVLLSPGINLDGATLREFNASRARLVGSSFRSAIFINASLDRIAGLLTDFTDSNLALSFMWNAHFAHSLFDDALMSNTDIREALFYKCSLKNVSMEGALIEGASFTDCELDSDAFVFTIGTPIVTENGRRLTETEVTEKYRQYGQK